MDRGAPVRPDLTADDELRPDEDRWLRCVDCENPIAPLAAAIAVNGAHQHEFVNPAAEVYIVRCFAQAPGAGGIGERSKTWTWFPGFAWEIELCRRCSAHIGWSFHGATTFYGLIGDQLR